MPDRVADGTIRAVRMTLEDLRNPGFASRMMGYDRDEVDRLLGAVADSVEKLQRRRQRDAAAMEGLTREVAAATNRALEAEQRLSAMAEELAAVEHAAAEAEARAEAAEEATSAAVAKVTSVVRCSPVPAPDLVTAAQASADAMEVLGELIDEPPPPHPVPLAVRAARALVLEARARAAQIVADAEAVAGGGYSSSSGSSATIQS